MVAEELTSKQGGKTGKEIQGNRSFKKENNLKIFNYLHIKINLNIT